MNLQSFAKHLKSKYGTKVNGVLHIGANRGEECEEYHALGWSVIWIEGDPSILRPLRDHIVAYPNQRAYCCLASDKSGSRVTFYRASNDGASSSILEPDENVFSLWKASVTDTVELITERLDDYFKRNGINIDSLNLINIDVQGYELPVLRGLSGLLRNFDVLVAELNWTESYKGATRPADLETYLARFDFRRCFLSIGHPQGYGIWVRRNRSWIYHIYMLVSIRVIQSLADLGVVRMIQGTRVRVGLRRFYYWLTGRETDS